MSFLSINRSNNRLNLWIAIGLCIFCFMGADAFGESGRTRLSQANPISTDPDTSKNSTSLGGLLLANEYLSELVPVLEHLRKKSPDQYGKAIRDLDRAAKRLESIKRRDVKLFEIALKEWQTRGKVDLLKARLRVEKKAKANEPEMLALLQSLRNIELARVDREIELLDQRQIANQDRLRQTEQSIRRGEELRTQLTEHRQRLQDEPVSEVSPSYLRAMGRNDSSRPATPIKPKSIKVSE